MRSFRVVEDEPVPDAFPGLAGRIVFVGIHLFPLERSPEPFRENIVRGAPFSIHADLDIPGPEALEIAVAGEMRSLVAVKNDRGRDRESPVHRLQDKWHLERLIQFPGDHKPGVPVDNGHPVHPSVRQTDVGNVDPPDVVRVLGREVPEEIRINLVLQGPLAEVRTRMDPFDPHLPHGGLDPRSAHAEAFSLEHGCHAATPIEWPAGVERVDPVPQGDLFGRRKSRSVIEPGAGQAQQ